MASIGLVKGCCMSAAFRPEPGSAPDPAFTPVPRRAARLILAAFLAGLGLWVARSFLAPFAWAVTLAIALWPLYWRLAAGSRRRVLLPLLFTVATALILVIPVTFAAVQAGSEIDAIAGWLGKVQQSGVPQPDWLPQIPLLGRSASAWWQSHLAQPKGAEALLGGVGKTVFENWTRVVGAELLSRLFAFFVTLLALFFLFRDGQWLGERLLAHADRVFGDPGERLAERLVGAARGTFNGTVLVAVGEGLLIGAGYVAAGVPQPVLFGIITAAFAMLPLGAWFAFTLAALVLLGMGGGSLAAALLFLWGAVVMLIGDNLVQPRVVGASARLPFLGAFVGIFGGLNSFGLVGLFVGPVIMTALVTIWREWIDRRPVSRN